MSLLATAIVSRIEAKEFLQVPDDSRLDRLDQVIGAATNYVEGKVEFPVKSRTYTDVLLDGSGSSEIWISAAPITKVTKVEFLRTDVPEAWDEQLAATYPVLILTPGRHRIAYRTNSFPYGLRTVRATYNAGYADADGTAGASILPMPELFKEACLQACQTLWTHFDRTKDGIASLSISGPNGSTTTYLDQALPKLTIDALKGYRVPVYA